MTRNSIRFACAAFAICSFLTAAPTHAEEEGKPETPVSDFVDSLKEGWIADELAPDVAAEASTAAAEADAELNKDP